MCRKWLKLNIIFLNHDLNQKLRISRYHPYSGDEHDPQYTLYKFSVWIHMDFKMQRERQRSKSNYVAAEMSVCGFCAVTGGGRNMG